MALYSAWNVTFLYCGECGDSSCRKVKPGPFASSCRADWKRPMPHRDYVCTCDEPDCDSYVCDPCFSVEAGEWAAYFGIRPGMSKQERANQIEAMRPLGCEGRTGWEADES
jgi:hypothetical protein